MTMDRNEEYRVIHKGKRKYQRQTQEHALLYVDFLSRLRFFSIRNQLRYGKTGGVVVLVSRELTF